jgi:hypothetical protein
LMRGSVMASPLLLNGEENAAHPGRRRTKAP